MEICDEPRTGIIYDTYKQTKNVLRKTCWEAFNKSVASTFNNFIKLYKEKQLGKLWNKIRRATGTNICKQQF